MRTLATACVCAVLCVTAVYAQPTITWQRNLGGSSGDLANSLDRTTDGGYVAVGVTNSSDFDVSGQHGVTDVWVTKVDPLGELEWQLCLGGSGSEEGLQIRQCADAGYILVGRTSSTDGDVTATYGSTDIWVVKLTQAGELEWQRSYGGSGSDIGYAIEELPGGGFALLAETGSLEAPMADNHGARDLWLAVIGPTGELQWSKCYGGSDTERARDLCLMPDGGYLLVGNSDSDDGDVAGNHGILPLLDSDAWVLRCNALGEILWQRCLGSSGREIARSATIAPNGKIYVKSEALSATPPDGDITDPIGETDIWIARLSQDGELEQQRSFGGTADDLADNIISGPDNEIFVLGTTRSSDGNVTASLGGISDLWLFKLNSELDLLWQRSLGGSLEDVGKDIHWDQASGALAMVGRSNSADGDLTGNYGSYDMWLVKFNPETVGITEASSSAGLTLYPNPSSDQVRIQWNDPAAQQLEVVDALGRVVYQEQLRQQGNNERVLAVGDWANGLYTVRVLGQKAQQVSRFIKKN